jgi:fructokinase
MTDGAVVGSVEAGGTKFVCATGTGPHDIRSRTRIDTTTPAETLDRVAAFFRGSEPVAAVGVASFGPVELRRAHPSFGHITTTPKPGWQGIDLLGRLRTTLGAPVAIETDVTGAALGEWTWGAGRGLRNLVYVTVGTGIGGGALVDGAPVPGLVHAEMGHVSVRRLPGDGFPGVCPYHGDCLEGMASGPAIEARWGRPPHDPGPLAGEATVMESAYLASGLRNVVYTVAPERVVLGGGVSSLPGLVAAVNAGLVEEMGGYAAQPEHGTGFVVLPALGADSGIAGGFALALTLLGG